MSDAERKEPEQGKTEPKGGRPDDRDERAATADLSEGLELMLRAARKAVRNIDAGRLEDLGRRARQGLQNVSPSKLDKLGRKAAEKLDPRRIEEIAEEAGRELLGVVERVAERVEKAVGAPASRRSKDAEAKASPDAGDEPPAETDAEPASGERDSSRPDDGGNGATPPKVRVE